MLPSLKAAMVVVARPTQASVLLGSVGAAAPGNGDVAACRAGHGR